MPHQAFSALAYLPNEAVLLLFLLLHLGCGAWLRRPGLYRPFLWRVMEKAAAAYEFRLNRGSSALVLRGVFVAVFLGLAGLALGLVAWRLGHYPFGWLAALALLLGGVSVMGPLQLLRHVAARLAAGDATMAAALLTPYAEDDLSAADAHKLCRRALEFAAVGFNRYFIAPIFYFLLAGSPGLALYVALLSLFGVAGRPGPFGRAARAIEAVADFIPARLGAGLIAFAAIATPRANPGAALVIPFRQSSRFSPANCGWTIAAVAGALEITLGGPQSFRDGAFLDNGWLGPKEGTARISALDVKSGAMLMFIAFICAMVFASVVVMAINKFTY